MSIAKKIMIIIYDYGRKISDYHYQEPQLRCRQQNPGETLRSTLVVEVVVGALFSKMFVLSVSSKDV